MEPESSLPHSQVPATCPYHSINLGPRLSVWTFRNEIFFFFLRWVVVSTSPNPQSGGPPLVCCPRLLIQFIRSYPPYRKGFLYPQPEDAPCRGDRDPLWHGPLYYSFSNYSKLTPRYVILAARHRCTQLALELFMWDVKCYAFHDRRGFLL